jgi:hypothetical protein
MFNILANLRVCLWIFLEHLRVMGVVVSIHSFLAKADCGGVFEILFIAGAWRMCLGLV